MDRVSDTTPFWSVVRRRRTSAAALRSISTGVVQAPAPWEEQVITDERGEETGSKPDRPDTEGHMPFKWRATDDQPLGTETGGAMEPEAALEVRRSAEDDQQGVEAGTEGEDRP